MTLPSPMVGLYVGLNAFKHRSGKNVGNADRDADIASAIEAASRAFERDCGHRFFFPYTTTNFYRWPPFQIGATWALWVEADLLSVSAINVAATGQNASPVAVTHYFLEPQQFGPPYSRIEVDLSYGDVFQSGPTPQRAVSVAGRWGFTNATAAAGTVTSGLASDATVTTFVPSNSALLDIGNVLSIDAEDMYVSALTPLTVQRGVNGTTSTTHANAASIAKYVAPADVQLAIVADALSSYEEEQAAYGRTVGAGDMAVAFTGAHKEDQRLRIIEHYERVRSYAI